MPQRPVLRCADRPHTGRVRNERTRRAILTAALSLALDNLSDMTVDSIARSAGVGKQTIYRWWSSKWEVVLDALLEYADQEVVILTDGPLLERVVGFLSSTFALITGPGGVGPLLGALMAQAQVDPGFAVSWREKFVMPRRRALMQLLDGTVEQTADNDAAVDLLFGGMWYRLLVSHGPLDEPYARRLAMAALSLTCRRAEAPPTE
jgi:AcrR family transcriptional regulator